MSHDVISLNADLIAPVGAADPDQIVVTARGKTCDVSLVISLGARLLDRCSSIVFDKPAKQIAPACGN